MSDIVLREDAIKKFETYSIEDLDVQIKSHKEKIKQAEDFTETKLTKAEVLFEEAVSKRKEQVAQQLKSFIEDQKKLLSTSKEDIKAATKKAVDTWQTLILEKQMAKDNILKKEKEDAEGEVISEEASVADQLT